MVETGLLDDGYHRGRQLALAVLGWVLTAALIVWLLTNPHLAGVKVSLFLVIVALIIAIASTLVAIDLLRPPLIRARHRPVMPIRGDTLHDALGRQLDTRGVGDLRGEFTIVENESVRRYGHV